VTSGLSASIGALAAIGVTGPIETVGPSQIPIGIWGRRPSKGGFPSLAHRPGRKGTYEYLLRALSPLATPAERRRLAEVARTSQTRKAQKCAFAPSGVTPVSFRTAEAALSGLRVHELASSDAPGPHP
jgi:hypothetical protein